MPISNSVSVERRPTLHLQQFRREGGPGNWKDIEVYVPMETAVLLPTHPGPDFHGGQLMNQTGKVLWVFGPEDRDLYNQVDTQLRVYRVTG